MSTKGARDQQLPREDLHSSNAFYTVKTTEVLAKAANGVLTLTKLVAKCCGTVQRTDPMGPAMFSVTLWLRPKCHQRRRLWRRV